MRYTDTKIKLLGSQVLSLSLSQHRDMANVSSFGDLRSKYIALREEVTANVVVLVNRDIIDLLEDIWQSGFVARSLGPGQRCAYCGSLWLPGVLACPACGGYTLPMGKSIEMARDGILRHMNIHTPMHGVMTAELEFEVTGTLPLVTSDVSSLLFSKPGHWLCEYCGFICKGDDFVCPGCGGKRPPVHELLRMKRICIYCGKETYGGYRCPECNGRLK